MRALIFALALGAMCASDAGAEQDAQAVKRALLALYSPCTQTNETDRYRCVCSRFCRTRFPPTEGAEKTTLRIPIAEVGGLQLDMTGTGTPLSCSYTTMTAEVLASSVCKAAKPRRP